MNEQAWKEQAGLEPCPFCEQPLTIGGGVNPYGRCDTKGCWMNASRISVAIDDPKMVAIWNTRHLVQQAIAAERGEVENARDILSGLSSYLGAGLGDDATTLKQFDERIRWGIDHIGSVYRNRAAQVVEECSKRPRTTWGEVKRAIMDDTTLPTAASTDHEATIAQLRDRVAGLEEIPSHIAEQVLSMGRAEWGATSEKTSAEHLADFENTLRLTRENFNLEDIPVQMHGLYLEGAETILCHTGTSPNSGANAQALVGAWNWLYDQCKARALLTQNEVG